MSDAYLPGLTVSELTLISKVRRLPLQGEVLVKRGERVEPETVVAQTHIPGRPHLVPAANLLNLEPADLPEAMLKKPGDSVAEGEIIARYSAFFGLFRGQCQAPAAGEVEHISTVTGQVTIREPAVPVVVRAYISGEVTRVLPGEGVVVETPAALIQGIFGIGGEGCGKLRLAAKRPGDILTARQITAADKGCILVGGALVTADALERAEEVGAAGIVCGGILDKDLHDYLGYEIGVAITGHEEIGLSVLVTEGFGKMPMAEKTFQLLQKLEGQIGSINGTTQIRAGVLRPEIIVPRRGISGERTTVVAGGLEIGTRVRVIRTPWFGRLGEVKELPVRLQKIESEARVRVLVVKLEEGNLVTVPRANVEILA